MSFEMGAVRAWEGEWRRKGLTLALLLALLLAASLWALSVGSASSSPLRVLEMLLSRGGPVYHVRLPRVISAVVVGAALGSSGLVVQTLMANPMATPFTLGISSGAAFGAAAGILLLGLGQFHRTGEGVTFLSPHLIPLFAFAGALASASLVLALGGLGGLRPEALVLCGVAMGSFFQALLMLLQYFAADEVMVSATLFWSFGNLGRMGFREVLLVLSVLVLSLAYYLRRSWDYNALQLGDEVCASMGVDPLRLRLEGMGVSSLLVSACVSFSGVVGFVGLVAGKASRLLLGGDHLFLVPASALLGAILLLLADTLGRTLIAPVVIPVGITTSLVGVPLLLYLLLGGRGDA